MALDPDELYEVDSDVPDLAGAVLLHHFDGFVDAGSAGGLVAEQLLAEFAHRVVARFDVDRLIDYRARRPPMIYVTDHWAEYRAPELVVNLLHDHDGTPFLLLTGPEPDREWELFAAAVRRLVQRWGVRLTVGFHGIPMGVPHTRPLGLTAHATRPELVGGYQPLSDRLKVPGSIAGLLELRLGEQGHDAMGFAAHVPHYLAQASYAAAGLTLLEAVADATGLALPADSMRESARSTDAEIDRQVEESEEVADVVRALERQYDTFVDAEAEKDSLLAETVEHMPTADELGSAFEQFLADQQGPPRPDAS
ncbi:proteasome assembly chaperone family protein [Amycolatopsis sp. YIM 10]|uniref:proteasome assembly chaperone family protein n=1 Tax=Amycolatopsis sp. YIM 10 TaxID=2653857 RepID=UPI00128FF7D8|nr:PAC2 family protein [Amycolatopsis sp. YIM 10]QFU93197.1 PAC2 family protein [Amycolatopsis sp. YIM 10]